MALVPVEEARRHVLDACGVLPAEAVALEAALGRVTAAEVVSPEAVPPFANTAMDGYAVRAADTSGASDELPVTLRVARSIAAGQPPGPALLPGEAIRIMTGAPLPPGADAIVMVERTRPASSVSGGDAVQILAEADRGDHVRRPGEDVRPGDRVVGSGTELRPAHLGVLASVGVTAVEVHGRPRVGVLSTGDELVEGGGALEPGQIRDSNRRTLLALLRDSGFEAVDLGIARDSEDEITAAVDRGVGACDALLTSGGVSVGDFDYVKAVLDRRSAGSMRWMQVAVRPAKPFAFGVIGGVPVFGLPGNPVSSMVSYELFARPALRQMAGHTGPSLFRAAVQGVAGQDFPRRPDGRLALDRVVASIGPGGRVVVRSAGGQGSHVLTAMARANALALVPDGPGLVAGEELTVWLLGDLLTGA
ncbi:MAG TPA: gephyrin-like molybdotransferase Glp [Acidimicrobiales bacterium]|nr:gephyrin-like molybdotransferase Glp [Acidimicrobiales bacterium]